MSSFFGRVNGEERGYHVYKDIWDAVVGEEFPCKHEDGNRVPVQRHRSISAFPHGRSPVQNLT